MNRQSIVTGALVILGVAAVSGCASHTSADTFNRSEVGRQQTVEAGRSPPFAR